MDMKLDIVEGKGVFYSENRFLKDSLSVLAFDENGRVKNEALSRQINSLSSVCREIAFTDYKGMNFTQSFSFPKIRINGDADMKMPRWILTDEAKVSKDGYNVKKAFAEYLGRKWTVWYTEDLPLPYGPWALWGTPGLIIMAEDSESLFLFRFMGLEEIEDSNRYSFLWDYYHNSDSPRFRVYDLDLDAAFAMYTNLMTNQNYQDRMTGAGKTYILERNGKRTELNGIPYIPLMPISDKTK